MSGATNTVAEAGTALNWLWETYFSPKPTGKIIARAKRSPSSLGDQELLDKARRARNGTKVTTLFDCGDWQGLYQSQSEADLALCSELAFWAGNDGNRIDGLFRQSRLFREKWERADYRDESISRAIACNTKTYSGGVETGHGVLCDRIGPQVATKRLATVDGWTVHQKKFEEPVFVIDKLLTAGLTVFAGRPKIGSHGSRWKSPCRSRRSVNYSAN
jgi:primase-polymerase (primpol)-like protein